MFLLVFLLALGSHSCCLRCTGSAHVSEFWIKIKMFCKLKTLAMILMIPIEVLSINPSASVFLIGTFNVYHKDWLTCSGGTDRLVNSVTIFLPQNDLSQMVNFLLRSQIVTLTVLLFYLYICFFWCKYLFYNSFLSIAKLWSCCCLSLRWLSIKFTAGCHVSLHSLPYFL